MPSPASSIVAASLPRFFQSSVALVIVAAPGHAEAEAGGCALSEIANSSRTGGLMPRRDRRIGEAVGAERLVDRAHVRRAVRQIAVVVVGDQRLGVVDGMSAERCMIP